MILKDKDGKQLEAEVEFNMDGTAFFSGAVYLESGVLASDETLTWLDEEYSPILAQKTDEKMRAKREDAYDASRGH